MWQDDSAPLTPTLWEPVYFTSDDPAMPSYPSNPPLTVDWGLISMIIASPSEAIQFITKNGGTVKQKVTDLWALAAFLDHFHDLCIRQSVLDDQIQRLTEYRDDTVADLARSLRALDRTHRLIPGLWAIRDSFVGRAYPASTTFPTTLIKATPQFSADALHVITNSTACTICTKTLGRFTHSLVHCPHYTCATCSTVSPGHAPRSCPNRVTQRVNPEYREVVEVIQSLPPTSKDHLSLRTAGKIATAIVLATPFRPGGQRGNPLFVDEMRPPPMLSYYVVKGG